jgi:hypothetical protein
MYLLDDTAPASSAPHFETTPDIEDPVEQPGYDRREASRQESRRSYLALCKARGVQPDAGLLDMLSWSRFHGWAPRRS